VLILIEPHQLVHDRRTVRRASRPVLRHGVPGGARAKIATEGWACSHCISGTAVRPARTAIGTALQVDEQGGVGGAPTERNRIRPEPPRRGAHESLCTPAAYL
jgi:hypothetical protein